MGFAIKTGNLLARIDESQAQSLLDASLRLCESYLDQDHPLTLQTKIELGRLFMHRLNEILNFDPTPNRRDRVAARGQLFDLLDVIRAGQSIRETARPVEFNRTSGEQGDVTVELQSQLAKQRAWALNHLANLRFQDWKDAMDQWNAERQWMSHADPSALELDGETITPMELYQLLSDQDEDEDFGGVAFLNACQTAQTSDAGSFFQIFKDVGFSGMIGTEQQTLDTFANPLGIDFLEAFLKGEPIGPILHRLRLRVPLGLLYGAYCPPDIRIASPDEDEDSVRVIKEVGLTGKALRRIIPSRKQQELLPLPDEPYRSLTFYDRKDRALFAGRDDDVDVHALAFTGTARPWFRAENLV